MLKTTAMFIMLLLASILIGCQQSNNVNEGSEDAPRELEDLSSAVREQQTIVSISTGKEVYTLPIAKLGLTLDNNDESAIKYDNEVYVDKLQDGEWSQLSYKENTGFTMEAHTLKPRESFEQQIALEYVSDELTEGKHRVRKSIRVGKEEFIIADTFEVESN